MTACHDCSLHKGGYCRYFERLGQPAKPIPLHVLPIGCKKWQAIVPEPKLFEDDAMPSSVPVEDYERPRKRRGKLQRKSLPTQPSVRYEKYQWCPHLPKCDCLEVCQIRLKRVEREASGNT